MGFPIMVVTVGSVGWSLLGWWTVPLLCVGGFVSVVGVPGCSDVSSSGVIFFSF